MRDRDRKAAAARADVEHAVPGRSAHHGSKPRSIDLRERRARHEHALVDFETANRRTTPRRRDTRAACATRDSLHREIEHRERDLDAPAASSNEIVAPFLHVPNQPERFVARVVCAVTEHEIVRREKIRERRERRFAVVCAEQPLLELSPRHARASYSPAARRGTSIDVVR